MITWNGAPPGPLPNWPTNASDASGPRWPFEDEMPFARAAARTGWPQQTSPQQTSPLSWYGQDPPGVSQWSRPRPRASYAPEGYEEPDYTLLGGPGNYPLHEQFPRIMAGSMRFPEAPPAINIDPAQLAAFLERIFRYLRIAPSMGGWGP